MEIPYRFKTQPACYLHHILTTDGHIQRGVKPSLNGAKIAAFAGIAGTGDFFRDLTTQGAHLIQTHAFSDHHAYGREDLEAIRSRITFTGAQWLATTAKDDVRLPADFRWPVPMAVYDVSPRFIGGDGPFFKFIGERLREWRRGVKPGELDI